MSDALRRSPGNHEKKGTPWIAIEFGERVRHRISVEALQVGAVERRMGEMETAEDIARSALKGKSTRCGGGRGNGSWTGSENAMCAEEETHCLALHMDRQGMKKRIWDRLCDFTGVLVRQARLEEWTSGQSCTGRRNCSSERNSCTHDSGSAGHVVLDRVARHVRKLEKNIWNEVLDPFRGTCR